jgi:hypothetical protein
MELFVQESEGMSAFLSSADNELVLSVRFNSLLSLRSTFKRPPSSIRALKSILIDATALRINAQQFMSEYSAKIAEEIPCNSIGAVLQRVLVRSKDVISSHRCERYYNKIY